MVFTYNEYNMFESYIDHVKVITDSPENPNISKLSDLKELTTECLLKVYTRLSYLNFKYGIDSISEYDYIRSFTLEMVSVYNNNMIFWFKTDLYKGRRLNVTYTNNEFDSCSLVE